MEAAKGLKVNAGTEPDADLGPVISRQVSKLKVFFFFVLPPIRLPNSNVIEA